MGEQASERAGQERQRERPRVAEPGAFPFSLIGKGLGPIQETICDPHDRKSEGYSRDEHDGAPSAHCVRRVASDDEEGDDHRRDTEDD